MSVTRLPVKKIPPTILAIFHLMAYFTFHISKFFPSFFIQKLSVNLPRKLRRMSTTGGRNLNLPNNFSGTVQVRQAASIISVRVYRVLASKLHST